MAAPRVAMEEPSPERSRCPTAARRQSSLWSSEAPGVAARTMCRAQPAAAAPGCAAGGAGNGGTSGSAKNGGGGGGATCVYLQGAPSGTIVNNRWRWRWRRQCRNRNGRVQAGAARPATPNTNTAVSGGNGTSGITGGGGGSTTTTGSFVFGINNVFGQPGTGDTPTAGTSTAGGTGGSGATGGGGGGGGGMASGGGGGGGAAAGAHGAGGGGGSGYTGGTTNFPVIVSGASNGAEAQAGQPRPRAPPAPSPSLRSAPSVWRDPYHRARCSERPPLAPSDGGVPAGAGVTVRLSRYRRHSPEDPPDFSSSATEAISAPRSIPLTMSYTVSAATVAAVSASISTPVRPARPGFGRELDPAPPRRRPFPRRRRTTAPGHGTAGSALRVRLAAWIPGDPSDADHIALGGIARAYPARGSGLTRISARATARRSVAGLSPTSTMRARPSLSRWVRSFTRAACLELGRLDQILHAVNFGRPAATRSGRVRR